MPAITHLGQNAVEPAFDHPRPDRLLSAHNPLRTTWTHFEEGALACGIWACEPGAWKIRFADHKQEFFCVIAGRVRLHDEAGLVVEVGPGEAAVIPAGFAGTFEVLEAVRKYFVVAESAA